MLDTVSMAKYNDLQEDYRILLEENERLRDEIDRLKRENAAQRTDAEMEGFVLGNMFHHSWHY